MASPARDVWKAIAAVWRRLPCCPRERAWTAIPGKMPPSHAAAVARASLVPAAIGSGLSADCGEPADLLARRMAALRLEPGQVSYAELQAFRELQTLCARCECRGRCARDLADEFADPAWQDWRDYCPNATTLSILSALRGADAH